MMDMETFPRLARGCRLHATRAILLIPEGALQLSDPARDILALIDGSRNVQSIVKALFTQYDGADPAEIRQDVLNLLCQLERRNIIRG